MSKEVVWDPHDAFFRKIMGDNAIAGHFLRHYLPRDLAEQLAPDPPVQMPGTFVDDNLKKGYSDVLFRVRLRSGGEIWPYVLLEHKSGPDKFARLQLLRYYARILADAHLQDKNARLPAVVLVIVHHGPRPWKHSLELLDLITAEVPESCRTYVTLRHEIVDLAGIDDADFPDDPRARTFFMLMKYIRRKDLRRHLAKVLVHFLRLGMVDQAWIIAYINEGPVRIDRAELKAVFKQVAPDQTEAIMGHISQPYIEEGIAQGLAKGLAKGLTKTLASRFGSVPDDVLKRVHDADPATLEIWLDRAVVAASLESVFDPSRPTSRKPNGKRQKGVHAAVVQAPIEEARRQTLLSAVIQDLVLRFGALPDNVLKRLLAANLATLQTWFPQVIAAASLESIFGPSPTASPPPVHREGSEATGTQRPVSRQGPEEGGQQEALSRTVAQILTQRFGALPDALGQRVRKADLESLQTWLRRAVGATTLESVLEPAPSSSSQPGKGPSV